GRRRIHTLPSTHGRRDQWVATAVRSSDTSSGGWAVSRSPLRFAVRGAQAPVEPRPTSSTARPQAAMTAQAPWLAVVNPAWEAPATIAPTPATPRAAPNWRL